MQWDVTSIPKKKSKKSKSNYNAGGEKKKGG
jgi:hypothetical protein